MANISGNNIKRIAIIFDGSLDDRKGLVNAVLNRAKSLKSTADDMQVDLYNFQTYENWLIRTLRGTSKYEQYNSKEIEGMNVRTFWIPFSLIDYISEVKLKSKAFFTKKAYISKAEYFKGYDLISAHSKNCGALALKISRKYGIPYVVTWHGSDIHSAPFTNKHRKKETIEIAKNAECNFFVSQALSKKSEVFMPSDIRKEILYNGVGSEFMLFDKAKRTSIRKRYNPTGKKVVCFAGNVIDIKNPLSLPPIFKTVRDNCKKPIVFWVLGDGKLRVKIETLFKEYGLEYKCWGNVPAEKMPEMLNCVDILVLPSKNEGLPLITVEALACGANVVGSRVGGIPEVIGIDYVFDLDDNFVKNISKKIIEILENPAEQKLKEHFDWQKSSAKEYKIYKELIQKYHLCFSENYLD